MHHPCKTLLLPARPYFQAAAKALQAGLAEKRAKRKRRGEPDQDKDGNQEKPNNSGN